MIIEQFQELLQVYEEKYKKKHEIIEQILNMHLKDKEECLGIDRRQYG